MLGACVKSKYAIEPFFEGDIPCVKVSGVDLPDVDKTFDCGQCFRFEKVEGSRHECEYSGVAFGRFVSFANDNGALYIYNSDEDDFYNVWQGYLGLVDDYRAIERDILSRSDNPALKNAVGFGRGIRILRQDPWEALCSFIISQNNNIPRIKKLVGALCRAAGEPIDTSGMECHGGRGVDYSFPSADKVAALGIDGLAALRTGFRAKYIFDAATKVASGELSLSDVYNAGSTAEAAERLCSIKGVGPKVAACALLFGFGRFDAFPIDVWIKRVIEKYFSEGFSADDHGGYAGIAQQYLFYYERYLGGEKND